MAEKPQLTKQSAFEIKQKGIVVASATGRTQDIIGEAWRYMHQYIEDGTLEMIIRVGRP